MKFKEIADSLGIISYPSELDTIFEDLNFLKPNVCDETLISALQDEFQSFGDYYEKVITAARQLAKDPVRLAWAQTVAAYDLSVDLAEARKVLCPPTDGSLLGNMLPLFALLPMIPVSIADYRRRGFSEDVVRKSAAAYGGCMKAVEKNTGKPGLNQLYFSWLCIYAKAHIYYIADYNFEIKKFPAWVYCLQNRENGDITFVAAKSTIHKNGNFLGSGGSEDPEGSFETDFQEAADCYIGYPVEKVRFVNKKVTYPKKLWKCILRPNDDVLNLHIPAGVDLTPSRVEKSIQVGMDAAKKFYPEIPLNILMCSSWLLDPVLEDFLGENSKIAMFGKMFRRFPVGGGGRSGFHFIFPGKYEDERDLPENTRLQRAVKKHFLNGGHILSYGGIYIDK